MKAQRREKIFTGSLLLGISAVLALMIGNIFVTQNTSEDQRSATARVIHTLDVIARLDEIYALVFESESAQRGFILTSDADFLSMYATTAAAAEQRIDELKTASWDDLRQRALVQRLGALVNERLKQTDEVVQVSKGKGLLEARRVLLANRSKETMTSIQGLIVAMKASEDEVLAKRLRSADASHRRSQSLNLAAGVLGLLALGAFVFLVDRTLRAREAAADEIARQRETLRVTLASIGHGVISTDVLGRVVFLNAEAERLTGWETSKAAGSRLERVFPIVDEETREPFDNPAAIALREGADAGPAHPTLLIGRDGDERPIDHLAAPIRDSQGRIAGAVLIFRDVSKERSSTHQLRQLASELSETDRRKNEFLAMLAHEIRNPLAAIRNSVAILRHGGREAEIAAAQGAIERQMVHLVRLIDDLLDVARISRGKLALQRSRMDLRQALEQAIEVSLPMCRENEQVLDVEIPDTPLHVDGDAVRITQAIANLLNNACKFTQRGGRIRLTVGVENGHAIVRIQDNGIGIAAEHLPRLFDMFSQIDTSLERTQGGLGIGLNLVKQLVEMHGGRVEVRSGGIGKGSEFIVHFPVLSVLDSATDAPPPSEPTMVPVSAVAAVSAVSAAPAPASVAGEESGARLSSSGERRKILVVDDNADAADSLAILLGLQGHETEVARDGLEAVEKALRTLPDVVLLDIGLPRLNGYEAARRIRLSPAGGAMRLIAVTGWGQDEDRNRSREAGFDDHLVKPVDVELLGRLLAKLPPGSREA
ncbi:MAG: CHASE3 domain-containing protein [Thermoanaerobaculia bacterium]|nr:CHASE3 domain-containing protein [Thermoanaerobaculia bacterium]MBP9822938.1 CHASE3 domain-containing protein [Thermoanaerobaculia bacterium]